MWRRAGGGDSGVMVEPWPAMAQGTGEISRTPQSSGFTSGSARSHAVLTLRRQFSKVPRDFLGVSTQAPGGIFDALTLGFAGGRHGRRVPSQTGGKIADQHKRQWGYTKASGTIRSLPGIISRTVCSRGTRSGGARRRWRQQLHIDGKWGIGSFGSGAAAAQGEAQQTEDDQARGGRLWHG